MSLCPPIAMRILPARAHCHETLHSFARTRCGCRNMSRMDSPSTCFHHGCAFQPRIAAVDQARDRRVIEGARMCRSLCRRLREAGSCVACCKTLRADG